jgi:DNA-binding GntR family transcriptional regulator
MQRASRTPSPPQAAPVGNAASARSADSVDRVYREATQRAVNWRFAPGERINEVALARELGVSRTPVREALNRLARDGFVRFVPNRGFLARDLSPELVRDLYELRAAIEVAAVRLACARAADEAIAKLARAWNSATENASARRIDRLTTADEVFHRGIARLSGNEQLVATLERVNAQIRYFRHVDQETPERLDRTHREHAGVLDFLTRRDARRAGELMERHIVLSRERALSVTEQVIARIRG